MASECQINGIKYRCDIVGPLTQLPNYNVTHIKCYVLIRFIICMLAEAETEGCGQRNHQRHRRQSNGAAGAGRAAAAAAAGYPVTFSVDLTAVGECAVLNRSSCRSGTRAYLQLPLGHCCQCLAGSYSVCCVWCVVCVGWGWWSWCYLVL